jgi:hypothetical protein
MVFFLSNSGVLGSNSTWSMNICVFVWCLWRPLLSSGQSSWLQIQRFGFDSRRYQIFWEVVGLEQGPLSLMSTTEELLERKSSGSGLESREYGRKDPSRWPRGTLYLQKLALTSSTSGGRSDGIVRSRTQPTEFFNSVFVIPYTAVGSVTLTMWHPPSAEVVTNFADKRRSLGRSVTIVRSRTQTTEFFFILCLWCPQYRYWPCGGLIPVHAALGTVHSIK